jgi:hypothetical protein
VPRAIYTHLKLYVLAEVIIIIVPNKQLELELVTSHSSQMEPQKPCE